MHTIVFFVAINNDVLASKCAYDLCKRDTGLKQCAYCGEFFCKNHIEAKVPLLSDMPDMTPKEKEVWDRPGGHLCDAYKDYLTTLESEQELDDDEEEKHSVATCAFCHKEIPIKHVCESCGKAFCYDHRFPEKHNCKELKSIRSFKKPEIHTGPIKTIVSLLALVFILTLVYFTVHPEALSKEVVVQEWRNVSIVVPLNTSLAPYADNLPQYLGRSITVKGFLLRSGELANVSVVKTYVLDDEGSTIEITVPDANQRKLLPASGQSEDVYIVSGVVEKDVMGSIRLVARKLTLSERSTKEVVSLELTNATMLVKKNTPFANNMRLLTDNIRDTFH